MIFAGGPTTEAGVERAEVAVEQGLTALELWVARLTGLGVEPVDGAEQSHLVDADLRR
jgi:hypothetical protein